MGVQEPDCISEQAPNPMLSRAYPFAMQPPNGTMRRKNTATFFFVPLNLSKSVLQAFSDGPSTRNKKIEFFA